MGPRKCRPSPPSRSDPARSGGRISDADVLDPPHAVDLDADYVTGTEQGRRLGAESDPARRTREDEVPGLQRGELGDDADHLSRMRDHRTKAQVLHGQRTAVIEVGGREPRRGGVGAQLADCGQGERPIAVDRHGEGITYDDGRVGKVVDGTVIELDVPARRCFWPATTPTTSPVRT